MCAIMAPRFVAGAAFYDAAFWQCYQRLGYPRQWLEQGQAIEPHLSYVVSHPSWYMEEVPAPPLISIYELFARTVAAHRDEIAVVFMDKAITYGQLDDLIGRYAGWLTALGLGRGDVAAAMLPNSLQHVIAFYGAAKAGVTHCPINVMYQADEVAYQLKDCGAKAIVALDLLYDKIRPSAGQLRGALVTNIKDWAADDCVVPAAIQFLWDIPKTPVDGAADFFEALAAAAPLAQAAPCAPKDDVALLLYTAGTTGKSKGVIETHFNMVYNSLTHTHAFRTWGPREVNFSIMPMFHTAGYFLHLLPVFYQGGTVIPIAMFDVADCFRIIETYGVNVIFAPPTLFIALLQRPELVAASDLSSIKVTIGCGAPVPPALQEQWEAATGARLVNGWGMTETNSGGIISTPGIKDNITAIGVPLFSEVLIVGDDGKPAPRGQQGEIWYRGLQVAKGYLNKPQQTAEAFLPDGWFRTGDRGYVDEADFVHFVDRIKDLIVASGYNVAPVEIEDVLYQHPAVAEAAVIGVPDAYRGETIKAYVVLKAEAAAVDEATLLAHCKERLATFKAPRQVEIRQQLPKSAVGKILRRVLREEHEREAER